MKHNIKLTIILLVMFLVTQLIGLAVVNFYLSEENKLPYLMEPPAEAKPLCPPITSLSDFLACIFPSLIMAFLFAIAIFLIFLLIKIKSIWFMRVWFFIIVVLGLGITLTTITRNLNIIYPSLVALLIALIFAYIKVFKRNLVVHNLTELMIYPGIAAVFVTILNIWAIIIFLLLISAYDIWAVWHSGIMQKMAKFQINKLRVFSGFFVPYASGKIRGKIKKLRLKYRGKEIPQSVIKKQKIKVNLAILGGGDIIFPIIAAGVFLKTFGNIWASLMITFGASLALLYLFVFAKKRKFYPAMPFLTTGIFLGMIAGWLFLNFL